MTNKIINYILVGCVILVIGVVIGAKYFGPKPTINVGTTPAGATFGDAKTAVVVMNLGNLSATGIPQANATSSTILNSSPNDYYITTIKGACQNIGTSFSAYAGAGITSGGLNFRVATSATAAPNAAPTAGIVSGLIVPISTTTTYFSFASSTTGVNATSTIIWTAGSYLTFTTNATNTALCSFGVDYFSS